MSQTTAAGRTFLQRLLDGVEVVGQQGSASRRHFRADVCHRHCAVADLSYAGNQRQLSGHRWKLGLPLLLLFFTVAEFLVPVLWRF